MEGGRPPVHPEGLAAPGSLRAPGIVAISRSSSAVTVSYAAIQVSARTRQSRSLNRLDGLSGADTARDRFRRPFALDWVETESRMISLVQRLGRITRNAGRAALAASAVNLVCGLLIVSSSSAHLIAVTVRRVHLKIPAWVSGEPHAVIAGVPYDFRIYSLLLWRLGRPAAVGEVQDAAPILIVPAKNQESKVRRAHFAAGGHTLLPPAHSR